MVRTGGPAGKQGLPAGDQALGLLRAWSRAQVGPAVLWEGAGHGARVMPLSEVKGIDGARLWLEGLGGVRLGQEGSWGRRAQQRAGTAPGSRSSGPVWVENL